MEGISGYVGMQAAMLQRSVSMSILDMAMTQGADMMSEMLSDMPVASGAPVAQGDMGYNLDVYA